MLACRVAFVAGLSLFACGIAAAQTTVEMRIVEMSGQTRWYPFNGSNVLNYSVQARVVGSQGRGLGDWPISIRLAGEPEGPAFGTLARLRIADGSGPDGQPILYQGPPTTSTLGGGSAGVANQYRYLVGLSSYFNGVFNISWGTYTNGPEQEILGVVGAARGGGLLMTGIVADNNGDGVAEPVAEPQFGTALTNFFGANGNWVEVYRFRYTLNSTVPRTFTPVIDASYSASTFTRLIPAGDEWSADTANNQAPIVQVDIQPFQVGPDDVDVAPATQTVGVARTATLTIPSSDVPNTTTFQWRRNGVLLVDEPDHVIGTQSRTLNIVSARITDSGTYDCIIGPSFQTLPATVTVFCLSDFNRSGTIEIGDVFEYLNSWFAGCSGTPASPCNGRSLDIDNSGTVNIADIFAFLNLWFGRAVGQC